MVLPENQQSNEFELDWENFFISENILWEWKTKILYEVFNSDGSINDEYIIVEEKDIATAWDWADKFDVSWKWEENGKAVYTSTINANFFEYLNELWQETAFIKPIDSTRTLVKKLDMVPVECVYRLASVGSHQRREQFKAKNDSNYVPLIDWEILEEMVTDFYYKDDVITTDGSVFSDPLIKLDNNWNPEIDESWKMVLLNPDTEEILDYEETFKRLDDFPRVEAPYRDPHWPNEETKLTVVKHFTFSREENWDFKTKTIWGIDYMVTLNRDNGNDITEYAKITPYMLSISDLLDKNKEDFEWIQDNITVLREKTKEAWLGVKSFMNKADVSLLDWKVEFWIDKVGRLLLWDSVDADSNRLRIIFTVIWEDWQTYLTRDDFTDEELGMTWKNVSYFKRLNKIPENIAVKQVWLVVWLDKDWLRVDWETWEQFLAKIKRLAELSNTAKEISDKEVEEYTKANATDVDEILKSSPWEVLKIIHEKLLDVLWRELV